MKALNKFLLSINESTEERIRAIFNSLSQQDQNAIMSGNDIISRIVKLFSMEKYRIKIQTLCKKSNTTFTPGNFLKLKSTQEQLIERITEKALKLSRILMVDETLRNIENQIMRVSKQNIGELDKVILEALKQELRSNKTNPRSALLMAKCLNAYITIPGVMDSRYGLIHKHLIEWTKNFDRDHMVNTLLTQAWKNDTAVFVILLESLNMITPNWESNVTINDMELRKMVSYSIRVDRMLMEDQTFTDLLVKILQLKPNAKFKTQEAFDSAILSNREDKQYQLALLAWNKDIVQTILSDLDQKVISLELDKFLYSYNRDYHKKKDQLKRETFENKMLEKVFDELMSEGEQEKDQITSQTSFSPGETKQNHKPTQSRNKPDPQNKYRTKDKNKPRSDPRTKKKSSSAENSRRFFQNRQQFHTQPPIANFSSHEIFTMITSIMGDCSHEEQTQFFSETNNNKRTKIIYDKISNGLCDKFGMNKETFKSILTLEAVKEFTNVLSTQKQSRNFHN